VSLLHTFIVFLSSLSALPAVLVGFKRRTHLFWWYCLSSLTADASNIILSKLHIPCGFTTNIFLLLEWLLIGTYLTNALFEHQPAKIRQAGVALIGLGFAGWSLAHGFNTPSYSGATVLYCTYIGLLLACLHKIMRDSEYLQLEKSPLFIFCAIFLLYTSGIMTLLVIVNYLDVHNPRLGVQLWVVHNILNTLKNGVLAYCIYLVQKQKN
jgi:hypothetical protein